MSALYVAADIGSGADHTHLTVEISPKSTMLGQQRGRACGSVIACKGAQRALQEPSSTGEGGVRIPASNKGFHVKESLGC